MAKNRIVYVIFLAVTLFFLALNESQLTYTIFYMAILFPLLSLLFMLFSKRTFEVSDKLSAETVQKNERLTYYFTIKNTSRFYYTNVKAVFNDISSSIVLNKNYVNLILSPYKNSEASIELYGKYRGVNKIGISEIYVYDLLGLFYLKQKIEKTLLLTVLPQVSDISGLIPQAESIINSTQKSRKFEEDYTEIEDHKKYQPIDSLRRINWKISAKKNELISKVYKANDDSLAYIIFDNSIVTYLEKNKEHTKIAREDQMIEVLVSILAFFSEKQLIISLNYVGDNEEIERLNTSEFAPLYAKASTLHFNHKEKLNVLINDAINHSSKQAVDIIFIFTQILTVDFKNMVSQIISNGCQAMILLFGAENDDDIKEKLDMLNETGAICKHIPDFSMFSNHMLL